MRRTAKRYTAGLSLIELLVAMVIGLLLVLGMVEVFGASRAAYALSEGMGRAQENGRFAMDFLQRDIRMAGHFGCVNDQARKQTNDVFRSHFTAGGELDFGYSIRGYDDDEPDVDLDPERIEGTDSITLRFLTGNGAPILSLNTADPAAPFVTIDPAKWDVLQQGGVASPWAFGVADCAYADVFAAAGTDPANGKVVTPGGIDLSRYGTSSSGGPAMLHRAEAIVYYIGEGAGGRPSLWRARINADGSSTGEELVEGVEDMQLLYGMDSSSAADPTGFIASQGDAGDVGTTDPDWRRVGQVQVALLVASPGPAVAAQASQTSLNLLGNTVTPGDDGRYRTVYETTIALRNRLYGN